MRCAYFAAGTCKSCTQLGVDYQVQLAAKLADVRATLAAVVDAPVWAPPFSSRAHGYRNKAKLVVAGTANAPTLGILDPAGNGVDLRECGLHEVELKAIVPALADFIAQVGLEPYAVAHRRGELKHILVTHAPNGEFMVRFVLRSRAQEGAIRAHLPALAARIPGLAVVSINVLAAHKAVLEGDTEVVLTERRTLTMHTGELDLVLPTRSFFQVNTAVAAGLYRQAQLWVREHTPQLVWDLYCGIGGFALHAARAGAAQVVGVEVSGEAIAAARQAGAAAGLKQAGFVTGDALAFARDGLAHPDLVIVNPPRRGIGELATWLEASQVRTVIYSSCNATSLARDLATMGSFTVRAARLFDMFPQTHHHEVMVLATRADSPRTGPAIAPANRSTWDLPGP